MGKKENEAPKSFRLSISLPALNDLDEITDFIAYVNGQPLNAVKVGDAIAIPPGQKHKIWNTGDNVLHLLCCCAPCYEHADTFITEK